MKNLRVLSIGWENTQQNSRNLQAMLIIETGSLLTLPDVEKQLTPLFPGNINLYRYFSLDFDKPSILEAA